jgi:uncharacterized protein (TIGR03437 family)
VGAAGAAYVFVRASATWSQQAKLTAPANGFGNSVAIDADTVVVGAIFADGGFGAAFIFTRSDGMWTQQQKLVPGGFIGEFGAQVAIEGTTVLVVSPAQPIIFLTTTADPNQFRGGVVYVFIRSGEIWTEQQVFSAGADPEDFFGNSVAIDADTVVVGAPFTDIDSKLDQGAAYVFTRVECQTITISPAALPDAVASIPYNQTLTASGGIGPITFSLAAGALPAGLSIDPAGSISGTPAGPGTFNFTVRATDAVGCTEMNTYTVKTAFSGFVTVSAASYTSPVASKEIVAGFGVILPLPTSLAGARVIVKDSAGIERVAPLYFISPSQINYQIPDGTALGPASISAFNDNLLLALGSVQIVATAPSIFALNASGFGPAAALDALTFLPAPFNAELADGAPNFIAVWGTGLGADATDGGGNVFASVTALIDGEEAQVTYAGLAPGFQGANQFNIQLPLGITSGEHTLTISRGAMTSNEVTILIQRE